MAKVNKAGEKEMKIHMKTVEKARAKLSKQAQQLGSNIKKDMTFALSQDRKILKDMRATDRRVKK